MKLKFVYLSVIVILFSALKSCKDDNNDTGLTVFVIDEVYHITTGSVTVNYNLSADFTRVLTVRGLVWGTGSLPELGNNSGYSSDGSDIGEKHTGVGNLKPGTRYYVRGYATYGESTVYSEPTEFTTASGVTDIDGNYYESVIINNLEWMAENLRVIRYRNGDAITNITGIQDWQESKTEAYAWPQNDYETYGVHYGAFYNYFAVSNPSGLCPAGWRLPEIEEWESLIEYLGGRPVAGGKLKSIRTSGSDDHPRWNSPNAGATDEFSFSAFAAGHRTHGGNTIQLGEHAWWWTSDKYSLHLNYNNAIVGGGTQPVQESWLNSGYSVRCVR